MASSLIFFSTTFSSEQTISWQDIKQLPEDIQRLIFKETELQSLIQSILLEKSDLELPSSSPNRHDYLMYLAFNHASKRMVREYSYESFVEVIDLVNNSSQKIFSPWRLCCHPNLPFIAFFNFNKVRLTTINLTTAQKTYQPHQPGITSLTFNPKNQELLLSEKDTIQMLTAQKSEDISTQGKSIGKILYCPNGETFAAITTAPDDYYRREIDIFNTVDRNRISGSGKLGFILDFKFSPNGKYLVYKINLEASLRRSNHQYYKIPIAAIDTPQSSAKLVAPIKSQKCTSEFPVAFTNDSKFIVYSDGQHVSFQDMHTRQVVKKIAQKQVSALALSKNNGTLAISPAGGSVLFYTDQTAQEALKFLTQRASFDQLELTYNLAYALRYKKFLGKNVTIFDEAHAQSLKDDSEKFQDVQNMVHTTNKVAFQSPACAQLLSSVIAQINTKEI